MFFITCTLLFFFLFSLLIHFSFCHQHPSLAYSLTDVSVPRCRSCCDCYHCPFCPTDCIKPGRPLRIAKHILASHWNRSYSINGNTVKCFERPPFLHYKIGLLKQALSHNRFHKNHVCTIMNISIFFTGRQTGILLCSIIPRK